MGHNNRFAGILFIFASLLFLFAGCASIFHGSKGEISLNSDPSGASFYVDGKLGGITPDTIELAHRSLHNIEFRKDGYASKTVVVDHSIGVGWIVLDLSWAGLIVGSGVLGMYATPAIPETEKLPRVVALCTLVGAIPTLFDALTGKWYSLNQDDISIILEKEEK